VQAAERRETIEALASVTATSKLQDIWFSLFNAKNYLEQVFGQSIYTPYLRASREKAVALHATLERILARNQEELVGEYDAWFLNFQKSEFRIVFLSDVNTVPSFLVVGKEGHDTNILSEEGFRLFPASMGSKVPETLADAKEVGKALAYELATACGFHVFRVTESVIKCYWDHVSKGASRPNLETIGTYASELEKQNYGDAKVYETLKQMAKLHRNPLIHPEVILTVEEAVETLGIARSVIGTMLRTLPDAPLTTSTANP
jgi:hypothetical protein